MKAKVLIAGGGVAGLESAIALHEMAGDRVEVTICSPGEDFVYRPFAVAEPYGASRAMRFGMEELAEGCGADFRLASIASVDQEAQQAHTHDGEKFAYDYLIVASGTRLLASVSGAVVFWGVADDRRVQDVVDGLREEKLRRVAFTMPGGGSWALPMYELALLAESELSKGGVEGASLVIVTPEDAPLDLFGRAASERVAALLVERGIEAVTGTLPVRFDEGEGCLSVSPRAAIEADAVLSLPRMEGRRIGGVPHNLDGFIRVDDHCRVRGTERIYAAGDATTFPVKQGGVSAQQADVAAEAIAAELGLDVEADSFDPILRGVLWTGAKPLYLSGYPTGGHGENSVATEDEPSWRGDAQHKIVSRYLAPFLDEMAGALRP